MSLILYMNNQYYKNYKTREEWLAHIELLEIYNKKLLNISNNMRKVIQDNMSIGQIYKINECEVYKLLEDWDDTNI